MRRSKPATNAGAVVRARPGRMVAGVRAACITTALVACGTPPSTHYDPATETDPDAELGTDASVESGSSDGNAPTQICCGCTCIDPTWSCTTDTCISEGGVVAGLSSEAGLFELEGAAGIYGDPTNPWQPFHERHRYWYAFIPAQEQPEHKPLLVFFNGGPGSATMSGLFAMNIGPWRARMDPNAPGYEPNPDDWSTFANLLFVDARFAGFSYGELQPELHAYSSYAVEPERDAADMLAVILRFVARHPALEHARVVPVGESFGGFRALMMMHLWERADQLATGVAPTDFVDASLADEIAQAVAAGVQMSEVIMIQGALGGFDRIGELPPCESEDDYACHMPAGDLDERFAAGARAAVDPEGLSEALGVDVTTIEWMHSDARQDAWVFSSALGPDETAMTDVFGPLQEDGRYFTRSVSLQIDGVDPWRFGPTTLRRFLELAPHTRWFVTDAAHDRVVYMPHVVDALDRDYPELVASVDIVPSATESPRPDVIEVQYVDGTTAEIRYPHYAQSGHAVSTYEPTALRDDVASWLANSPRSGLE